MSGLSSPADVASRFIILCAARTGSTMLRHLLNAHPDACCHGEVMTGPILSLVGLDAYARAPLADRLSRDRDADPLRFLREVVLDPGRLHAVGFKIKYDELVLPQYAELLETLRQDVPLKVIHLKRANRLKRLVSHVSALQGHGRFNVMAVDDIPHIEPFSLSPETCIENFDLIAARERRFAALFDQHPMIEVQYEAILAEDSPALIAIQRFLGLAPARLHTSTLKIGADRLADVLTNYEALSLSLAPTPFASYFD